LKKEIEEIERVIRFNARALIDVTVKFCLRALGTSEASMGGELNHFEINQIATKEVEAAIIPEFVILAAKKAEIIYLQKKSNFNSYREVLAIFTHQGGIRQLFF